MVSGEELGKCRELGVIRSEREGLLRVVAGDRDLNLDNGGKVTIRGNGYHALPALLQLMKRNEGFVFPREFLSLKPPLVMTTKTHATDRKQTRSGLFVITQSKHVSQKDTE